MGIANEMISATEAGDKRDEDKWKKKIVVVWIERERR